MALLAEELVEEWLNRQGYFTIRSIKLGVNEMDLLALRASTQGLVCRHVDVQASVNPVAYIRQVPKAVRLQSGRAPRQCQGTGRRRIARCRARVDSEEIRPS